MAMYRIELRVDICHLNACVTCDCVLSCITNTVAYIGCVCVSFFPSEPSCGETEGTCL